MKLIKKFRHDGIVIAVTFWQWFVELLFNISCIGVVSVLGANRQVDHFFALLGIWFSVSVLPSFYFMASADFRRDLEANGIIKSFWLALTQDSYDD